MGKKKRGSTATNRNTKSFRERLGKTHEDSIKEFQKVSLNRNDTGTPTIKLLLIDIVLIFLLVLILLVLMVFVQSIGVATLDVSMSASGSKMPPLSDIIFTSAVVGGLCGAVIGWSPRLFLWMRRSIHNKVTPNPEN